MNFFYANQLEILNKNIADVHGKINISFEFFPPRSTFLEKKFWCMFDQLHLIQPNFVSVTYGANHSTEKNKTYDIVKKIKNRTKLIVMPHMTVANTSSSTIINVAKNYWKSGIRHILALRGDVLNNGNHESKKYASDLVTCLKKIEDFDISVAAYPEMHPEAKNMQSDLINLKKKIDAGASRAITQFFFDVESYLRFRDRCISIGIEVEIIPGILPIFNFQKLKRFSKTTNVHIPNWIHSIFLKVHTNDFKTQTIIGANIALDIIKVLIKEGIKNLHFYTLNHLQSTFAICKVLSAHSILLKKNSVN